MSKEKSLTDFLREKKERDEEQGGEVDWEAIKDKYLADLEALYGQIEDWLKTPISDGVVAPTRDKTVLKEEHVGQYNAESLVLTVGRSSVRFRPVGAVIVGAKGRVDVLSGRQSVMLILGMEGGWHFARRRPNLTTWPLTQESFEDLLLDFLAE